MQRAFDVIQELTYKPLLSPSNPQSNPDRSRVNMTQENIMNSSIERTKFLLKAWSKFLGFCKVFGELLLWFGTSAGPLMVLTMVMMADFYLVWKPAIFTFLPGSDYKRAFIQAKQEVARFFRHHVLFWHRQEIKGLIFHL